MKETVQKHVVVETPGERREVLTESKQSNSRESGLSTSSVAIIGILAITIIGVVLYLVSNRNQNDAANRNANLAAASQASPITIVQQPAQAQQAPIIIEQPAQAQQAPVIIQQPAQPSQRENTSANDDANMQDIASKRLIDEPDMIRVVTTIADARAVLTGTVNSAATKAKAEQLVKGIRGVKSVDNKIVVTGE